MSFRATERRVYTFAQYKLSLKCRNDFRQDSYVILMYLPKLSKSELGEMYGAFCVYPKTDLRWTKHKIDLIWTKLHTSKGQSHNNTFCAGIQVPSRASTVKTVCHWSRLRIHMSKFIEAEHKSANFVLLWVNTWIDMIQNFCVSVLVWPLGWLAATRSIFWT